MPTSSRSFIYSNIVHPSYPLHSTISQEKASLMPMQYGEYLKPRPDEQRITRNNKFRLEGISKDLTTTYKDKLDSHRSSQTVKDYLHYEIQESCKDPSSSSEEMEADLDEGYTNPLEFSNPERTPELGKFMNSARIKNQTIGKTSSHVETVSGLTSYKTEELRPVEGKPKKLLPLAYPKANSSRQRRNHKSTSSLAGTQTFNERMKHFERAKLENNLRKKEEQGAKELKECTFKPKVRTNRSQDRCSSNFTSSYKKLLAKQSPIPHAK